MNNTVIAFIGAGHMASSLIGGLINDGYDPGKIWACDLHAEKLQFLAQQFGIHTTLDSVQAVKAADVVLFAVKPKSMRLAVEPLASVMQSRKPLVISIAAGVTEAHLDQWLGGKIAIVRCMPNTPALLGCGATGMHANTQVSSDQKSLAEEILRAVGIVVWLSQEEQINSVTALSGSGPAYFFLMMEALEQGAIQLGLPTDIARLLTLQTALGAARMALESTEDVHELRQRVTSPGGTTERALKVLEEGQLHALFAEALRQAQVRAAELAEES